MKKAFPILTYGFLAIIALDTLGALASRHFDFDYGRLMPLSMVIDFVIPFLISRRADRKVAIGAATCLGLFDSIVGWPLSVLLGANTGAAYVHITLVGVIITIVIVTGISVLIGLFAVWVAGRWKGR